jgi:hypothetical protein
MKIKEIIEMSLETKLDVIAKGLPVGEKRLRDILKENGCTPIGIGKRGWTFTGEDAEVLEKDISEFVIHTAKNNANASNSNSVGKRKFAVIETTLSNSKNNNKNEINDDMNNANETTKKNDGMKAEIQALIKGNSKENNARVYKGIYFDKDIAHFLDNVQHGNKSEIVNKILRQYLTENDLM